MVPRWTRWMSRPRLDDRRQEVVGGADVVGDGVALVARRLHRVGRGALLGEVDDGVRPPVRPAARAVRRSRGRASAGNARWSCPLTSRQAAMRSSSGAIGVSDWTPSSASISRRERLSTMPISSPWADRCSAVGQPQKPSPPRMSTRMTASPRRQTFRRCVGCTLTRRRRVRRLRDAAGARRFPGRAATPRDGQGLSPR